MAEGEEEFWLFAYGSLIWKPPPHYDRREPGYVEGFIRRFWQASEDHRGTPSSPGRVVTLISQSFWETLTDVHPAPQRVWGTAYRIKAEYVEEVVALLDIREVNGYTTDYTTFHFAHLQQEGRKSVRTLVYIGTPENPQFVGNPPPDLDSLAVVIAERVGPSGRNWEYLYKLYLGLQEICPEGEEDHHIVDLWAKVEALVGGEEVERVRREFGIEEHVVETKGENEEDERS